MSLSEKRILKQVTILVDQSAVNAQWSNQVLRDTEVISETFERKSYTVESLEDFLAEVEKANKYVNILGWVAT